MIILVCHTKSNGCGPELTQSHLAKFNYINKALLTGSCNKHDNCYDCVCEIVFGCFFISLKLWFYLYTLKLFEGVKLNVNLKLKKWTVPSGCGVHNYLLEVTVKESRLCIRMKVVSGWKGQPIHIYRVRYFIEMIRGITKK